MQGDHAAYREEPASLLVPALQTSLPGQVQGDQASYREEPASLPVPALHTSPLEDPSPEDVVTRLPEAVLELTLQTVAVSQEEPKKKEAVTCTVCQKKFRVKGNLGR